MQILLQRRATSPNSAHLDFYLTAFGPINPTDCVINITQNNSTGGGRYRRRDLATSSTDLLIEKVDYGGAWATRLAPGRFVSPTVKNICGKS